MTELIYSCSSKFTRWRVPHLYVCRSCLNRFSFDQTEPFFFLTFRTWPRIFMSYVYLLTHLLNIWQSLGTAQRDVSRKSLTTWKPGKVDSCSAVLQIKCR